MSEKLTYEEFVKQAILKLRTGDYKGIHTVYSGFNQAFRKYFDGANPIEITNDPGLSSLSKRESRKILAAGLSGHQKLLKSHLRRRGPLCYKGQLEVVIILSTTA